MSVKAKSGLMHRSKRRRYSITSSARANTPGAMGSLSAFVVLRLITSSNLVACSTGRLAGREAMIWTFMAALLLCDH
jgi:hypothetical protein